ncbi:MAG TPA: NAD-dependent epimerase/dehydratase family protein [Candidatus Binataceae bacterium]|nr:NAD-dependent epimerase/dehydratase family protein [Candidatus Binataceae bacterium]
MATKERIVLVTGGAGFIGSHLTDALIAKGMRTRVLDNFATGRRAVLNPRAELVEADICDPERIKPAFAGVDCVFHTAALARVPLSIVKPRETHLTNALGTLNVLMAAHAAGVRRVVYSGSSSVYGDQTELPLREEMTPNPLNPYALQKLVGEQYTRLFHQLFGLQTLTLRYFNVFGPRMTIEGAYVTVISTFLRAQRAGQPLTIHGDGEQTRDFTHVHDVVRANLLAMDCFIADGRALNIGQGRNLSVNRIAALFGGATVRGPARAGDARHTLADYSAAARVLGWQPQIGTEDGVAELIAEAAWPPITTAPDRLVADASPQPS